MRPEDEQYATHDLDKVVPMARENGFCLVKGFLDPARTKALEAIATALDPIDYASDFLSHGAFNEIMFDSRVLELARCFLGPDLLYYGETNCAIDILNPIRSWHCDARGMPGHHQSDYEVAPGEIYPAWRFAFYFRDYTQSSGGLKVGPGSHAKPVADMRSEDWKPQRFMLGGQEFVIRMPPYPIYNVPTQPGDLVIFNLRTYHTGGNLRVIGAPEVCLPPAVEIVLLKNRPPFIAPDATPRNAIFFDFATPSPAVDLYPKWRVHTMLKKPQHPSWEQKVLKTEFGPHTYDQPSVRAPAEKHGVTFRYDRIIGQLLWKRRTLGALDTKDQNRLDHLIAINPENSPHNSLREFL